MKTPKMRGSQEPLLLQRSMSGSTSLSSSYDVLNGDRKFAINGEANQSGYNNDCMFSEFSSKASITPQNNFARRRSMQSTNSLNRNFSRKYHRRGSIPCLSISAQSSPTMSPKKSHTAPDPFPELINSPPQTPGVDHRRSRSSNVDDRLWLDAEDLGCDEIPNNDILTNGSEDTPLSHTSPHSVENDCDNYSYVPHSSQGESIPVYSSTTHLLKCASLDDTSKQETSTDSQVQYRNSVCDKRFSPTQAIYNVMEYTSSNSKYSDIRSSPTHSSGRQSPESESVIYDQASAVVTPHGYTKQMLKVYTDEKNYKTIKIDEQMKAVDVCDMIVRDSGHMPNKNWSLVEVLSKFSLERSLEDHESVYAIYRSWSNAENNLFRFMKDSSKYDMFQNATQAFPSHMLEPLESTNSPKNSPKIMPKSQQRQATILIKNLIQDMENLPDVQNYLHVKESGRKTWKKHFCVLRKSGLYYSTKGCSKEPRHLTLISPLSDVNVYTATRNAKKRLGAPNNYCFCLKGAYSVQDVRDLRLFCAEDEQTKLSWVAALRLVKYGATLKQDFRVAVRQEAKQRSHDNNEAVHRSYGKLNPALKSRVAMDFTGVSGGRIVQDPNEALGVALQEAQHMRKKAAFGAGECHGFASREQGGGHHQGGQQQGQHHHMSWGAVPLHVTQPWFHCSISREQTVHAIHQQGMCDGVFLVRESQSLHGSYVLSMAHGGKVKHCTIKAFEFGGELFYSMDGGQTKFMDLIQLIEFYQINANGLPCRLTDYVSQV